VLTIYRGSPVPVTGMDGALQLVGLSASALSPVARISVT
jgi:hypothetical protein